MASSNQGQKNWDEPAIVEETEKRMRRQWQKLRKGEIDYENAQKEAQAAAIAAENANKVAISLKNRADSFARQLKHLKAEVDETKTLFTDSTRVLAHEIIGMILIAGHELWMKPGLEFVKLHDSPQFIASSVSRRWREVAIATPSIWSVICIPPSAGKPECRDGLRVWLDRSKACPLQLFITSEHPKISSTPVMDIIAPSISRWRSVVIEMDSPKEDCVMSYLQTDMPSLSTISIAGWCPPTQVEGNYCPPGFLRSAPQLIEARLQDIALWKHKPPQFPHLTEAALFSSGSRSVFIPALFSFLDSCPALVVLTAEFIPSDGDTIFNLSITTSARLTMPSLQVLYVDKVTSRLLCTDVHLPSLQTLRVSGFTTFELVKKHPAAITNLMLTSCLISTQALVPLLHSKPLLARLTIEGGKGDEGFCDAFIEPSSQGTFLSPKMQNIHVANFKGVTCDDLIGLLRARLPTNGQAIPKPWNTFEIKSADLQPWHQIELDKLRGGQFK